MLELIRTFVIRHFSDTTRESLRNFIKSLKALFIQDNLDKLAVLYGTDKFSHHYTPIYSFYLQEKRYSPYHILEIGIGGMKNPQSGGGSLKMWSKYFPNSNIFGIDIYDKSFFNSRKIKTYRGSQTDVSFLDKLIVEIKNVHIIIDDGSHFNTDVITTFKHLFPQLADGGYYFIEDIQTSYWTEYGGDSKNLNHPNTTLSYFKTLIDEINHTEIRNRSDINNDFKIEYIHFYHNMIVVKKQ